MNHTYQIDGMSCQNCVNKVKTRIQSLAGYQTAKVQLSTPQLVLDSETVVPVEAVQKLFPSYAITEIKKERAELSTGTSIVSTYKPLLLIVSFIAGVAALSQYPFDTFSWMLFMRHFMAGFFIVFAFFKLLNLKGFADSYAMYDLLAARWRSWGYIYPFLELGLGVAYLIAWNPQLTGIVTILLLGFSSIGVIQSNLDKRKIQCACLGDVFNLPMSVITIVEDLAMVAMALLMLLFA